jgi:hypothetical protein
VQELGYFMQLGFYICLGVQEALDNRSF